MGFRSNGTELADLLEPRESGDPSVTTTGWRENGVDLADKYAPASVGDPASNIGYRRNGEDVGPWFAAKGTRHPAASISQANRSASCFAVSGNCQACANTNPTFPSGGDWEFRLEFVSGVNADSTTPSMDAWHENDGIWQMCRDRAVGTSPFSGTFRIRIRQKSDTSNAASDTFTFQTNHNDLS
jgi:hypothetical protein